MPKVHNPGGSPEAPNGLSPKAKGRSPHQQYAAVEPMENGPTAALFLRQPVPLPT